MKRAHNELKGSKGVPMLVIVIPFQGGFLYQTDLRLFPNPRWSPETDTLRRSIVTILSTRGLRGMNMFFSSVQAKSREPEFTTQQWHSLLLGYSKKY